MFNKEQLIYLLGVLEFRDFFVSDGIENDPDKLEQLTEEHEMISSCISEMKVEVMRLNIIAEKRREAELKVIREEYPNMEENLDFEFTGSKRVSDITDEDRERAAEHRRYFD